MAHHTSFDHATLRKLAVASSCDPRTVAKFLRGEPVRGMARDRLIPVVAAAGIAVKEIA